MAQGGGSARSISLGVPRGRLAPTLGINRLKLLHIALLLSPLWLFCSAGWLLSQYRLADVTIARYDYYFHKYRLRSAYGFVGIYYERQLDGQDDVIAVIEPSFGYHLWVLQGSGFEMPSRYIYWYNILNARKVQIPAGFEYYLDSSSTPRFR